MDTMTMQKLARFKIMARRLGGFNVDIFRLAQERDYARETLARAQEVDNETLVLLALELSEALGLLERLGHEAEPSVKVQREESETSPKTEGYAYGARC